MPGIDVGTNFKKVKNLKFSTQNLDFPDFGRLRSIWSAIITSDYTECLGPAAGPAVTGVTRDVTYLECVDPGCYPTF